MYSPIVQLSRRGQSIVQKVGTTSFRILGGQSVGQKVGRSWAQDVLGPIEYMGLDPYGGQSVRQRLGETRLREGPIVYMVQTV